MSSTTNEESEVKKKRNWSVTMRTWHFYASMFVAVMILFYAVTGFLATHVDWFVGESHHQADEDIRTLPQEIIEDEAKIAIWCRDLIGSEAKVTKEENEDDELWFLVRGQDKAVQCIVDVDESQAEIIPLSVIAVSGDLEHQVLANQIADELGGHLNVESIYEDEDYSTLSFSVESVWFESHVSIFLDQGLYNVESIPTPFVQSLVHLHRGKHSNVFQTFLADLTAIMLTFVVITGVVIGIQMKKKRTMSYVALVISILLTVILIVAR